MSDNRWPDGPLTREELDATTAANSSGHWDGMSDDEFETAIGELAERLGCDDYEPGIIASYRRRADGLFVRDDLT